LPLTGERPLELGERAHDREQQVSHRRVLTGEGKLFLHELDLHTFGGQLPHNATQVLKVTSEAVHGVCDHGVAVTDEPEHGRQLRPAGVLARRLVGERAIDGDPVELPGGVLVQSAHPDVGNTLPADGVLPRRICPVGL